MKKYILIGLLAVAVIFVLFPTHSYPENIEVRGNNLGSMEDINNTKDKEFDIFRYKDPSNNHVLIFGIRNDSVRTLDDFAKLYLSNFQRQGFEFKIDGTRRLGTKGDEAIYMAELRSVEGVVIYIEKGATPVRGDPAEAGSVFTELENLSL